MATQRPTERAVPTGHSMARLGELGWGDRRHPKTVTRVLKLPLLSPFGFFSNYHFSALSLCVFTHQPQRDSGKDQGSGRDGELGERTLKWKCGNLSPMPDFNDPYNSQLTKALWVSTSSSRKGREHIRHLPVPLPGSNSIPCYYHEIIKVNIPRGLCELYISVL